MTAGSKKQQSSGLRLRVRQAIRFIIRQVKTEAGSALKPQIIKPQATLRQAKKGKTYYFTVKAYRSVGGKTYNGSFTTKGVKVK